MRHLPLCVFAVLWALLSSAASPCARADAPLPPPEVKTVWSPSHLWCAVMEPRTDVVTVYKVEGERRTRAWAMLGWQRVAWLTDDGEHLVVGHPGINLLPKDAQDADVLLYFVKKGELLATVTLADLVPRTALKPTASHLLWGSYEGLDGEGRVVVKTVEEKTVRFDPATGKRVP